MEQTQLPARTYARSYPVDGDSSAAITCVTSGRLEIFDMLAPEMDWEWRNHMGQPAIVFLFFPNAFITYCCDGWVHAQMHFLEHCLDAFPPLTCKRYCGTT